MEDKAPPHTLEELNELDIDGFTAALSGIFEHSSWIPRASASARPFASVRAMHARMCDEVKMADDALRIALICAHPELAGKAAVRGELTNASANEQRGAGLDQCSPDELVYLQKLNFQYREKFGFPFIVAVRGYQRADIIAMLEGRLARSPREELAENLEQIFKIAASRLSDLVGE